MTAQRKRPVVICVTDRDETSHQLRSPSWQPRTARKTPRSGVELATDFRSAAGCGHRFGRIQQPLDMAPLLFLGVQLVRAGVHAGGQHCRSLLEEQRGRAPHHPFLGRTGPPKHHDPFQPSNAFAAGRGDAAAMETALGEGAPHGAAHESVRRSSVAVASNCHGCNCSGHLLCRPGKKSNQIQSLNPVHFHKKIVRFRILG